MSIKHLIDPQIYTERDSAVVKRLKSNSLNKLDIKNLLSDYYKTDETCLNGVKLRSNTTSDPETVIDKLAEEYPLLQIAMPVNIENWDAENEIPVITFIPDHYQDGITETVTGWDANGDEVILDAKNAPDFPVLVIGENERVQPRVIFGSKTGAPRNLSGTATSNGILLTWEAPLSYTSKFIGYTVYRKDPGDSKYREIAFVPGKFNLNYIDTNTEAGKLYYYHVKSTENGILGIGVHSDPSNAVSVIGPDRPIPLLSFSAEQRTGNQIELRWNYPVNQLITNIRIRRWIADIDAGYNTYKEFPSNTYDFVDTNIAQYKGRTINYTAQTVSPTGVSSPLYDQVTVPYRDPSKSSPVRIWKMSYTDDNIEGWLRGQPEFCIKVINVGTDRKTPYEVQDQIYIQFNSRNKEQATDCVVLGWKPGFWYDVLTFYCAEDDKNENFELDLEARIKYKKEFNSGLGVDSSLGLKCNFDKKGEVVGYAWLDYYQPYNGIIEFPGYGVKLYISE